MIQDTDYGIVVVDVKDDNLIKDMAIGNFRSMQDSNKRINYIKGDIRNSTIVQQALLTQNTIGILNLINFDEFECFRYLKVCSDIIINGTQVLIDSL